MVMEGESPAHLLSWPCLIFHAVSGGTPGGPMLSSSDRSWSSSFLAFDQCRYKDFGTGLLGQGRLVMSMLITVVAFL